VTIGVIRISPSGGVAGSLGYSAVVAEYPTLYEWARAAMGLGPACAVPALIAGSARV